MPVIKQIQVVIDASKVTVFYGLDNKGNVWKCDNMSLRPKWELFIAAE